MAELKKKIAAAADKTGSALAKAHVGVPRRIDEPGFDGRWLRTELAPSPKKHWLACFLRYRPNIKKRAPVGADCRVVVRALAARVELQTFEEQPGTIVLNGARHGGDARGSTKSYWHGLF